MIRPLVALTIGALLGGCAVGPDYREAAMPTVTAFTAEARVPAGTAASVPSGSWWTAFGSSAIDQAVSDALAANADLAAARAALRVAVEQALAQRGALLPGAALDLNGDRQRTAQALSPNLNSGQNPYSLSTAQVNVAYAPDVFGGARRALESANASADMARWELAAAHASLATNVVATLVRDAALRAEIHDLDSAVSLQEEVLTLIGRQQAEGAVGRAAVLQQETALAQQQALLPPLRKWQAQNRDAFAALIGGYPATTAVPTVDFTALTEPATPSELPSELTRQRPDVRAADAALHVASANVGVAKAAQWPQLTLTASLGRTTDGSGGLLGSAGRFWDLGADLTQPIFQGGALLHRRRAAEAAYEVAAAQYRSTVLGAFQNVADVLEALHEDRLAADTAQRAEKDAQQTVELVSRQVTEGDAAPLAGLQAKVVWLTARAGRIDAQSNVLLDTVALYLALGGGWQAADVR